MASSNVFQISIEQVPLGLDDVVWADIPEYGWRRGQVKSYGPYGTTKSPVFYFAWRFSNWQLFANRTPVSEVLRWCKTSHVIVHPSEVFND